MSRLPTSRTPRPSQPAATMAGKRSRPAIRLKRVYESPTKEDGLRILVEKLWPRGFTKERAAVDVWLKEIAPSPELRRWYGHDLAKWGEFQKRYWAELTRRTEAVAELQRLLKRSVVTFVYAARDEAHNSAAVLKQF